MKVLADQTKLLAGLQAVQNVISPRATLPILSNVLLRASGDELKLSGTDLDVTITSTVRGVMVEREGAICLPAKRLVQIANVLTGEIDCDVDAKGRMTIEAGSSRFQVNGLPREEFPPVTHKLTDQTHTVTLQQGTFRRLLSRVKYAQSDDQTRFVLNGVLFHWDKEGLSVVATDGRRLAKVEIAQQLEDNAAADLLLPTKAVNELYRLADDDGSVKIEFNSRNALFTFINKEGHESTTVWTRLIEGQFPNFRQVIPAKHNHRIEFKREELVGAIRRASIMTSEKSNSLTLHFTKNNVTLLSNTVEVGEAREEIAVNFRGEEFAIAFNPYYLGECLAALDDDVVTMEFEGAYSPGVIKADGGFLSVIMPMRLAESPVKPTPVVEPLPKPEPAPAASEEKPKTKRSNKKAKNENDTNSTTPATEPAAEPAVA